MSDLYKDDNEYYNYNDNDNDRGADISKLHITTIATESKYYFPYLQESCRRNGKELEVLGMGEKWEGFNWKFKKMIDYLESLPDDDIVCFVDGYDVLCTRDLSEMIPVFLKMKQRKGCKMIVGEDKLSWTNIYIKLLFSTCKNISINSGTYIGTANDLLQMIQQTYKLNPTNDADDQILLTKYCNMKPKNLYIDIHNELFLTLAYGGTPFNNLHNHVNINDNTISYNNQQPFFMHAPGSSNLDIIIQKLGYDNNCSVFEIEYKDKLSFFSYNYLFIWTFILIFMFILLSLYVRYNGYPKKYKKLFSFTPLHI